MRIAIDVDSTLHDYWEEFAAAAKRRFGVDLPYEDQVTWGIPILRPEQLKACVAETHRADALARAKPYPGSVETVRRWKDEGHLIYVTSHRPADALAFTKAWLERIGLPYDDLHCSDDKVTRCVQLGIDVLIDDSPVTLSRALEAGIVVATIAHPWNRDLCEEEDVLRAQDWPALAAALEPVLAQGRATA